MKSGKELKIIAWDASKPLPSTPIPYSLYIVRDGVNFYIKPVDNTGAYLSQSLTGIGVQSVTGDGVDNSDPNNPVISFPIADDIDDSTSINKFITQLLIDKLNGIQAGAEQNVNADWNAISGDALILNKPNATSDFTNDGEGGDRFIEEQELGTAAYQAIEYFATALQGALADTALQPGDNISELVNDAGYVTDSGVLSVTGDGVDNTDPDNPVLSFPNASEVAVTPTGNLTSTDTQSALEELQDDIDNITFTPAGNDTEIQFNNSGVFGASDGLTWNGEYLNIVSKSLSSIYRGITIETYTAGTGRSAPLTANFSDSSTNLTAGLSGITLNNLNTTSNNYCSFNFGTYDTLSTVRVFGNMAVQFVNHSPTVGQADYVFNLWSDTALTERMRLTGDGNLTVGNDAVSSAFVWDNTNTRLGIGTSPSYPFHLIDTTASSQYRLAEFVGDRGTISLRSDTTNDRMLFLIQHDGSPVANRGVFSSSITGETFARFNFDAYGALGWGQGTVDVDTNLFRDSANKLRTNDTFIVDGNLGVGVTSPTRKLEVNGLATITGNGTDSLNFFNDFGTLTGTYNIARFTRFSSGAGNAGFFARYNATSGTVNYTDLYAPGGIDFSISTFNGAAIQNIYIDASEESVGIGTTTPSEKLHVTGNVKSQGLCLSYRVVSTSQTISDSDYTIDADTASIILTMMPLISAGNNQIFNLSNSSGGTITINTTSSEDIYMPGGKVTSVVLNDGESLTLQKGSSYWRSL